jgi:hypothetical protein
MAIRPVKYLRENMLGVAVGCAVTAFLTETLVLESSDLTFTKIFGSLLLAITALERYLENKAREAQLKKRGLTLTDIDNISFVKNWEVLRKRGIYKYCFLEGGLMLGLIILLPIALLGMLLISDIQTLFSELELVMEYTLGCMMIGYVTGAAIYLVRWMKNEKRFISLTDPLR